MTITNSALSGSPITYCAPLTPPRRQGVRRLAVDWPMRLRVFIRDSLFKPPPGYVETRLPVSSETGQANALQFLPVNSIRALSQTNDNDEL